jgi:plasmid stabilization system protein ParE
VVTLVKYKLEYLPVAEKDIRSIALYIANELKAPVAAANLVREIRKRANNLRDMPYIYREYRSEPQNETIYRAMPVKNHIAFYTVCEDRKTVEIHRVLYARMDIDAVLGCEKPEHK